MTTKNTHRAFVETSVPPGAELIASGPHDFCETALRKWIEEHPLNAWQRGVVADVRVVIHPAPDAEVPKD